MKSPRRPASFTSAYGLAGTGMHPGPINTKGALLKRLPAVKTASLQQAYGQLLEAFRCAWAFWTQTL